MNRIRLTAFAALLMAAVPATAGAQTFWDFVALNGAPLGPGGTNAPVNYAGPYNVCNVGLGCVALSVNTTNTRVLFKWNSDNVSTNDEKGVGICQPNATRGCDGDEVGDFASSWLLLDLSGLAPLTTVLSVTIASLDLESYAFDLCATATTGCGSDITGSGTASQAVWLVPITQGTAQWIRFKPGVSGNYIVQGITTTTAPEPGTMGLLATGLVALTGAGIFRRRNRNK